MDEKVRCGCKVGRMIEAYDLDDINQRLAVRRRGEGGETASLRDLADYFNREVLRTAMRRAGEEPLQGEVENVYTLLTDEETKTSARIEVRDRLERAGVDVEEVEKSFVSHPTMGHHLEECLSVERGEESALDVKTGKERIFKMQSRSEAVAENTLRTLAANDRLAAGRLTVTVETQVMCDECGFYSKVEPFIDRGGCDCEID